MMKLNHLSTFNKASIMLITGLSLVALSIPYAMAETAVKDVVAEAPADADFKKLDVNSDKKISLKEAVKDKPLATSFDMTDMNKDGSITPDEYSSYKASSMKGLDGAAPAATPSSAAPTTPPPATGY
jgi:EF hand